MDTADKAQRLSGVFPFPFCVPSSSPSSVFPPLPMFPPGFQQLYANLVQQQFLQLAQQQQQQSPGVRADQSPCLSDHPSSREDSPSVKKLQVDDTGCPICPLCGEKLVESEWSHHVEHEKKKLLGVIQSVKESKLMEPSSNAEQSRRKRELELLRIRNNQQKRLALKRGATSLIRDTLTPFSRQSNDESGSSGSPEVKKEEPENFGGVKCFSCHRTSDYGIVSSSFEQPRCQECFDALRNQAGALPATLTSVMDLRTSVMSPSTSQSPPEKKLRVG
uniref:Zinc finger domain containing protein n=1 Tax=Haemonchus contortus TaxID=6289 RepID=A0A7I4Y3S9_HAECO